MDNIKHKSFIQMLMTIPIVGVLLAIDHITKYWAYSSLRVNGPIQVITECFPLHGHRMTVQPGECLEEMLFLIGFRLSLLL